MIYLPAAPLWIGNTAAITNPVMSVPHLLGRLYWYPGIQPVIPALLSLRFAPCLVGAIPRTSFFWICCTNPLRPQSVVFSALDGVFMGHHHTRLLR